MGKCNSKSNNSDVDIQDISIQTSVNNINDNILVDSRANFDENTVNILRRELKKCPEIFILNNILMSMMFFNNFKSEFQKLANSSTTKMEKELNPKLLREEIIKCITPDVIFDELNKNLLYKFTHGLKKDQNEPLVSKRIYVVNDNIEVIDTMETPQYSAIDKPSYLVRMEESQQKGFVKLKKIDSPTLLNSDNKILNSDPQCSKSSEKKNTDEDSEYAYTTITNIKTPKPLEIINYERRNTLPNSCFIIRKVIKYQEKPFNSDSDDDDDEDPNKQLKEEDLFDKVPYISSKGFMDHFQNAIFPNSLGESLGFNRREIFLAKSIPGIIYCNLIDENDNLLPCEVIPSISIQWPAEQTFEFDKREERPTITDRNTGIRYRWPTDEMIKDIREMNCVLIPRGYLKKRGENIDYDIEWEIAFPKAERYIDTRMSLAQIKIFFILIALYKTYIEPFTLNQGLLVEHIRNHMYWECEANFRDWPEHRLGNKLINIINNFIIHLSRGKLSHFFIKDKNIFENIPKKYLVFAQRAFHNILESPIIYCMGALRNLFCIHTNFYSMMDFKKLYKILTVEGIKLVNENLLPENSLPPNRRKKKRKNNTNEDRNFAKDRRWRYDREKMFRDKYLKKKEREKFEQLKESSKRKISEDSINFEWRCDTELDVFKIHELLIFFIKHYIEISKKSRKLSTTNQALFYLKQSTYLCRILEKYGLVEDALIYSECITKEEKNCNRTSLSENENNSPPPTPTRNLIYPEFNKNSEIIRSNSRHSPKLSKY